jgi:nucleotide-binding universal stress UspA family protein
MSERGPIVCATDLGATGARAVELAARMASATGRPLRLVHVTAPGPGPDASSAGMSEAEQVLRERLRTRVEATAAALEKERVRSEGFGPHADAVLLEGRPWEEIIEYATRSQASLVVVGPHGQGGPLFLQRRGLTEHVLGTTADRVVRHSPCPVLVGPREGGSPGRLHGGRWIVGVDFSHASRVALRVARDLAQPCEAELVPVHVVPRMVAAEQIQSNDPLGFAEAERSTAGREHAAELAALVREELGHDLDVKIALGEPADALAEAAEALSATLLVTGTRGRTGLSHLLLGSVAERTLRRSPVPVLCVRPQPEMD